MRYIALLLVTVLSATPAWAELKVITTFSILADFAKNVGGSRVDVTSIVGPNSDAHAYEPKPDDARNLASADVVIVNGLAFEGWLDRLVEASGYKGRIVQAAAGVNTLQGEDEHGHAGADPHAWQDIANAKTYAANIADAFCLADAPGCDEYRRNAAAYAQRLDETQASIIASVAQIPEDRRIVITSHEAFGYFAKAYGITFIAPEGVSTEAEASARQVARLIRQIRKTKATALFVENISDPRLLQQIAAETGLTIGGALYSDALSDQDGPAPDYIAMMRHNARQLTEAMLTQ